MKLDPDGEAERWLSSLAGEQDAFDWDRGNRTRNRKHGVEAEEIESLLRPPFVFAGRIIEPVHPEPRWLLLGWGGRGRCLALIFTRRGQRLRATSRRAMRKNEREVFHEAHERAEGKEHGTEEVGPAG